MFRRLFAPNLLVILLYSVALLFAITASVDDKHTRADLVLLAASSGVVAILGVVTINLHLARALRRALGEMAEVSERVGRDKEIARVPIGDLDEVGALGKFFNAMSTRLSTRIAELEGDRLQLRAILSGMVEGVVALDHEQHILFVNERASQLLELSGAPPVGRRFWEVIRQRALLDVVSRALGGSEPTREEINWAGTSGRSLTVHAARLAGPPPHGGAVLVLHDTTDIRRLERLRQDFVANVSHELKTPLSVVKACVETLLDGAVDDASARGLFLQRIAEQSDRLYMLILDLLSLARIESGEELFEFERVPLAPVVRDCLERHQTRATARRQTLSMQPAGPAEREELAVWADEEAVDQILDNLVDNALKYTPEGGHIGVDWTIENGQVYVQVSDTGIGIPESDLARIFERFYRVDKARSREMGGTGLGLSIVKHLAQAMRGSVRATSRVGHGSSFVVSFPRAGG